MVGLNKNLSMTSSPHNSFKDSATAEIQSIYILYLQILQCILYTYHYQTTGDRRKYKE